MKNTLIFLVIIIFNIFSLYAQDKKTDVLLLGVFHFNFPNLDAVITEESNQIDVLQQEYQKEIENLVNKLEGFKPTIIVIERRPEKQTETDSIFDVYLKNQYQLGRNEEEQIGFRLAKNLGLKKLYCVDEWGDFLPKADSIIFQKDSIGYNKFVAHYENNIDKDKLYNPNQVFKTKGVVAELQRLNNPEYSRKSLGNYLIGSFKFEDDENDFLGVHFETGRWFNRNLKIFRNIQRIETKENDRILVVYGAGHLNLLNIFFESSPEYNLLDIEKYLD